MVANDTDFIFQPEILIRLRSRMFLFCEEARCLARVREIYQTSDSVHSITLQVGNAWISWMRNILNAAVFTKLIIDQIHALIRKLYLAPWGLIYSIGNIIKNCVKMNCWLNFCNSIAIYFQIFPSPVDVSFVYYFQR